MAAHPAGKGRVVPDLAADELLNRITRIETPFEEAAAETYFELHELLATKQADYGPRAITDSPGGALNGINVRMHDKLSRVVNLSGKYEAGGHGILPGTPNHESIRDTYRDLANYAVIALMVLDGAWPE